MLTPDTRVVLLDQLRAPLGYRLDAAVATTFTLDLAAALIPPLAFASFELRSTPDPVAALEAVRSTADRVDIFCQAGCIAVPSQASDLMAFLEPMVHEVTPTRAGFLFHPKVWFLRYVADDPELEDSYRLLCSSRNLATSSSWDAVVRLDATRGTAPSSGNRPLAALIRHLASRTVQPLPGARAERIAELAEDARYLHWELPDNVKDLAFHTFGIPESRTQPDFTGYKHLVVAPFCDDGGIRAMIPTARSAATLVSRPEALERLSPETLSELGATRVLDPLAGLSDADDDGDSPQPSTLLSGLHMKMVIAERNRNAHVFLGSANATTAALTGNVEFMIELIGGASRLGVDQFLSHDNGFGAILASYDPDGGAEPTAQDEDLADLHRELRRLASRHYLLEITAEAGHYDLQLDTDPEAPTADGYTAKAELLTHPGLALSLVPGGRRHGKFSPVALADITPFVVVRLTGPTGLTGASIVRAALTGDPPDRLDAVLARQVDTPEKFLRFLALMLGLAAIPGDKDGADCRAPGGGGTWTPGAGAGVLELLTAALADNPRGLADLGRLVDRLRATDEGRTRLPDGFEPLWDAVSEALKRRPDVVDP